MPADAYMELSDPDTWGETSDQQFSEKGRDWGAFQISSLDFNVTSNREDSDDAKSTTDPKATAGLGAAVHAHPTVRQFTVKKWIDKSSADLFELCCKQKKVDFARIFLRETGDVRRQPWLWLEFTGVYVDTFSWNLDPNVTGQDAKDQETVQFSFETIVIKYSQQDRTGEHKAVKIKGWDRIANQPYDTELETDALPHTY
jgi:type VI secretion system secreted protein Hcp